MTRALVVANAEFRALWAKGTCAHEMAAHYAVKPSVVRNCARRAGLEDRSTRKPHFDIDAIDADEVVRLWFTNTTSGDLADALQVSGERLRDLRGILRLPMRNSYSRLVPKALAALRADYDAACTARAAEAARVDVVGAVPVVPGPPFWTLGRDVKVFATGGRYEALRCVADDLGQPVQAVQARWHRLKAAA